MNIRNFAGALLAFTLLTGCTSGNVTSSMSGSGSSADSQIQVISEDRSGNAIQIPDEITSIVSMAPSTTQVLIDLGMSDLITAVDYNSWQYYEEDLKNVSDVYDMMTPDLESIAALNPSIVFTSGMSSYDGTDTYQALRDAGICVADIPSSSSIAAIEEDVAFIGACVGKSEESSSLIEEMENTIANVKEKSESVSEQKRVLFLISIPSSDYAGVYTFGTGTYLNEMLETLGAVNAAGDQEGWIMLSEEDAAALNPDVILTNVDYIDDPVGTIETLAGWENVNAIVNHEVYLIDANASSQPNQHVTEALLEMAQAVYPDIYQN